MTDEQKSRLDRMFGEVSRLLDRWFADPPPPKTSRPVLEFPWLSVVLRKRFANHLPRIRPMRKHGTLRFVCVQWLWLFIILDLENLM